MVNFVDSQHGETSRDEDGALGYGLTGPFDEAPDEKKGTKANEEDA